MDGRILGHIVQAYPLGPIQSLGLLRTLALGTHGGRNGYVDKKSGRDICPREWENTNGIEIAVPIFRFQVFKSYKS